MRSPALQGSACLHASFCCFRERALALSELRLFPSASSLRLVWQRWERRRMTRKALARRIAQLLFTEPATRRGAGACPYRSQRHRLIKSSNPAACSPRSGLYGRVAAPTQDYSVQLAFILDSSEGYLSTLG